MMKLVWNNTFKRSFRKLIRKNPDLKNIITNVLIVLSNDPFTPSLKSHKLKGNLSNYWSCSVTYDCRIIFTFSKDKESKEDLIILIDIGSHDEVY